MENGRKAEDVAIEVERDEEEERLRKQGYCCETNDRVRVSPLTPSLAEQRSSPLPLSVCPSLSAGTSGEGQRK